LSVPSQFSELWGLWRSKRGQLLAAPFGAFLRMGFPKIRRQIFARRTDRYPWILSCWITDFVRNTDWFNCLSGILACSISRRIWRPDKQFKLGGNNCTSPRHPCLDIFSVRFIPARFLDDRPNSEKLNLQLIQGIRDFDKSLTP
jgi:hypothetical protein